MPTDDKGTIQAGDILPLRALILLLLTSVFISGFLTGVLAMLRLSDRRPGHALAYLPWGMM
ncbi:hypothetical protein [Salmonella enterica]|uniref:hypothetical protein n=1 Tax=Salmonella enterica TaxID=28901 RepID=UPI001390436E|nr:hypothetical protein [Salmonella enterica]